MPQGIWGEYLYDFNATDRKARNLHFQYASKEMFEAQRKGKLMNYTIHEEDKLAVMQTWATLGVKHHYGQQRLVAIMAKTRVATLIMQDAHEVDHHATEVTVA